MFSVLLHHDLASEFKSGNFDRNVINKILTTANLLQEAGPALGRPWCDTLNASKFKNMKELRVRFDNSQWRIAFAFDPNRNAILLVAADKVGMNENRFYQKLISTADERFEAHLASLE